MVKAFKFQKKNIKSSTIQNKAYKCHRKTTIMEILQYIVMFSSAESKIHKLELVQILKQTYV